MNWNIIDNPIKRTFRIPVGNLSKEEEEIRKQKLIDRKLKIDKLRSKWVD